MHIDIDNLKDSNDFLNSLLENITSAIFLIDRDLKVHNFNNSFRTLFYKPEDQILETAMGNVLGCEFAEEFNATCGDTKFCESCSLRNNLKMSFTKKSFINRQSIVRNFYMNNKKVLKYFSYSTRAITYKGKKMVLVIVDDITKLEEQKIDLEEQNAKLENLNDLKNKFLGIAAHDLRSPMAAIQAFSELLLKAPETAKVHDYENIIKNVYETTESSLILLNDLLDISTIEAGKLILKAGITDYTEIVKKEIDLCKILAADKDISIELNIKNKLPLLSIDKNRIRQVINNLLINAIRYSPSGSKIILELYSDKKNALTKVIDSGKGIPKEDIPYIFEAYQTSATEPIGKGKSTGLGLAIVKKIIEEHHGEVGVNSKEGEGSVFYFSLPVVMM